MSLSPLDFHQRLLLTSLPLDSGHLYTDVIDANDRSLAGALAAVQEGRYLHALTAALHALSGAASSVSLSSPESVIDWFDALGSTASSLLSCNAGFSSEPGHWLALAAVSSLYVFTQANLTGPVDTYAPESPMDLLLDRLQHEERTATSRSGFGRDSVSGVDRWAIARLAENGEDLIGRIQLPQYLLVALTILVEPPSIARAAEKESGEGDTHRAVIPAEWMWWAARAVLLQQRVLSGRSAALRDRLVGLHQYVLKHTVGPQLLNTQPAVAAAALLEASMMEISYGHVDSARRYTAAALRHLGLEASLAGALGVRTAHQQDPRAQLVLETIAMSHGSSSAGNSTSLASWEETPGIAASVLDAALLEGAGASEDGQGLALESDVLRHPKLLFPVTMEGEGVEDPKRSMTSLTSLQQAAVLALALNTKKGTAADGLQPWEIAAHTDAVLQQQHSEFLLRAAAYLQASRAERQRSRTRERALLSLEGLTEALDRQGLQVPASFRRACAFTVWFPLRVSLRKELGEAFVALGLVGAALPLFESLELWDNLIACYQLLDKRVAAEELVRRRLEVTPDDARLWCALGDLTLDESYYEEAWKRSGDRSARAQRSLARSATRAEHYAKAATHWDCALGLSPLHPEGWFSLGWCRIKTKEYSKALVALTRSVQMEPENGETWNNLAAVHMHLQHWKEAFGALTEALKHKRESWHLWDNYADVAVKVGEWQTAVRALGQVVMLSKGERLDLGVLELIVDHLETMVGRGESEGNAKTAGASPEGSSAPREELENDMNWLPMGDRYLSLIEEDDPSSSSGLLGDESVARVEGPSEVAALIKLAGELMKTIASTAAGASAFWGYYARYYRAIGEPEAVVECLMKRVRALQGLQWRDDESAFISYGNACIELCTALLALKTQRETGKARMLLRGTLKQAEERFQEHPTYKELTAVLEEALVPIFALPQTHLSTPVEVESSASLFSAALGDGGCQDTTTSAKPRLPIDDSLY